MLIKKKELNLLTKNHVSVEVIGCLGSFFFKRILLDTVFLLNTMLAFFPQLFPEMCLQTFVYRSQWLFNIYFPLKTKKTNCINQENRGTSI